MKINSTIAMYIAAGFFTLVGVISSGMWTYEKVDNFVESYKYQLKWVADGQEEVLMQKTLGEWKAVPTEFSRDQIYLPTAQKDEE